VHENGAGTPQFSADHFRGYLVDLALKNVAEEFNLKIERFKVSTALCFSLHARFTQEALRVPTRFKSRSG